MGCHIAHDREHNVAILYCSTTDWAFGPVFSDGDDAAGHFHDAEERAEAFVRWLATDAPFYTYEREPLTSGKRDARELTNAGLAKAYSDWQAQEAEQFAREDAAAFADD
jgi:hypothetical protein